MGPDGFGYMMIDEQGATGYQAVYPGGQARYIQYGMSRYAPGYGGKHSISKYHIVYVSTLNLGLP